MHETRRIVFANDIPYLEDTGDPFESLADVLAFSADDWGETRAKAWIYGIVLGWDDATGDIADKFGWTDAQVARLGRLHAAFIDRTTDE